MTVHGVCDTRTLRDTESHTVTSGKAYHVPDVHPSDAGRKVGESNYVASFHTEFMSEQGSVLIEMIR